MPNRLSALLTCSPQLSSSSHYAKQNHFANITHRPPTREEMSEPAHSWDHPFSSIYVSQFYIRLRFTSDAVGRTFGLGAKNKSRVSTPLTPTSISPCPLLPNPLTPATTAILVNGAHATLPLPPTHGVNVNKNARAYARAYSHPPACHPKMHFWTMMLMVITSPTDSIPPPSPA